MIGRPVIGLVALGLAGVAAPLQGQNMCELFEEHMSNMVVGAYASWQMQDGTMKQAIVGTKEVDGQKHIWFEMAIQGNKKGASMVAKLLVPSFDRLNEVKDLIVQPVGEPAMRVPKQMISMLQKSMKDPMAEMRKKCDGGDESVVDLGTESVTVPAGTFTARHFRAASGEEMWIDMSLAFPLVKATTGGKGDMVLADHGTDATTGITGPIRDVPGF
jgi:hypothetical protein